MENFRSVISLRQDQGAAVLAERSTEEETRSEYLGVVILPGSNITNDDNTSPRQLSRVNCLGRSLRLINART